MNVTLAATATVAIILVGIVGAPALPVVIGAALACGWLTWRRAGAR